MNEIALRTSGWSSAIRTRGAGIARDYRNIIVFLDLCCCRKRETPVKEGKLAMKHWLFVPIVAVALSPGFVSAQDTAYKALRTIGAQRGEKALNQVIAISGQSGRPQPVDWRIALDDPWRVAVCANWTSCPDRSLRSELPSGSLRHLPGRSI